MGQAFSEIINREKRLEIKIPAVLGAICMHVAKTNKIHWGANGPVPLLLEYGYCRLLDDCINHYPEQPGNSSWVQLESITFDNGVEGFEQFKDFCFEFGDFTALFIKAAIEFARDYRFKHGNQEWFVDMRALGDKSHPDHESQIQMALLGIAMFPFIGLDNPESEGVPTEFEFSFAKLAPMSFTVSFYVMHSDCGGGSGVWYRCSCKITVIHGKITRGKLTKIKVERDCIDSSLRSLKERARDMSLTLSKKSKSPSLGMGM